MKHKNAGSMACSRWEQQETSRGNAGLNSRMGKKVRTGCIDRRDAWQALTMTIMKKVQYPLLALTLSESECNFIMAPALSAGFPKSGICRTTHRSLVHVCKEYQGLGLHKLHTTMVISHIQTLLDNAWSNSVTGKLMKVSLENMKLELDLRGSIFNHNYSMYNHLVTTAGWNIYGSLHSGNPLKLMMMLER